MGQCDVCKGRKRYPVPHGGTGISTVTLVQNPDRVAVLISAGETAGFSATPANVAIVSGTLGSTVNFVTFTSYLLMRVEDLGTLVTSDMTVTLSSGIGPTLALNVTEIILRPVADNQ